MDKINLGDSKLFKTILCIYENEGPVVVKIYFRNTSSEKKDSELNELLLLKKYSGMLQNMKLVCNMNRTPNLMPYQCILLENVYI